MAKIHEAAVQGDIAEITNLLKGGFLGRPDVEAKDSNGMTALHHAARHGRVEVVRLLLDKGATVDAREQVGITPLSLAASWGQVGVVQLLLESGADVNALSSTSWAPLHTVSSGEIAKALVDAGANVSAKADDGRTPLHTSVIWSRVEVMRVLLDSGADVNAMDTQNCVPLHLAVKVIDTGPVRDFLRYSKVDPDDETTVLASRIVRINAITLLLEKGASVNVKDKAGKTALQMARELREPVGLEAQNLLGRHGAAE